MIHRASYTEILIGAAEFKMPSYKGLLLPVLKIFTQLVSETIALYKWSKAVFLRNMAPFQPWTSTS
jgi:hypothetical protein